MNKYIYLIVACFLLIVATAGAQNMPRTVTVILEQPRQHIPDLSLIEQINQLLAVRSDIRVLIPGRDSSVSFPPNDCLDVGRLSAWGKQAGCQYIVYLRIDSRDIATKKQLSIPFFLSRYKVEGRLEGSYSLIDVNRGKLFGPWELHARMNGPRQWQVGENYPDDPELLMAAPARIRFIHKLEEKAAGKIAVEVKSHMRGR